MNYLTVGQVLFLHMRLIQETGGAHGIRDLGLLAAAVGRPQAAFGDQDLYPDLFDKAAALMHSLILNHPMIDGNKRLGIAAAAIFLQRNGQVLTAGNAEVEAFTFRVARGGVAVPEISAWFRAQTRPEMGSTGMTDDV